MSTNSEIKKHLTATFSHYFPDVKIKISIINENIHIGVLSASKAIVYGEISKYIFKTADFDKNGTLWNNGCQLTLRGWDTFHYLHELAKDYGMPTHFYLGMPNRTGFEAFEVK